SVELLALLGLCLIECVTVDGRGARVHPHLGWILRLRNGVTERSGRVYPRAQNLVSVVVVVPTIDALSRETNSQLGAVDHALNGCGIIPRCIRTRSTDDGNVVTLGFVRRLQGLADKAAPAPDDDT